MSLRRLPWLVFALLVATGFWWVGRSRASAPANDRVVLTWFSVITPLRDHYEAQAAAFMRAHPDIEVRILWVPNSEYNVKLKTLAAAGQLPDLFLSGDVWISYLLPLTMDITPFVERDAAQFGLQDFFPQIQAAMKHEGRYYIMPEYMNLSLLYYNRKMFSDAGLPEPTGHWTWDDLVTAGKRLTHAGVAGQADIWGCSRVESWWGEWLIYVRQAGGKVFTADGRRCLLDSPEAITGLKFYEEKSSRHHFSAPAGFEPLNGFVNQRVAMIVGGHVNYWLNYNQVPDLDWDVQLLPAGPAGRSGGELAMAGYSIARTSRHPEAAWELAKFLTRPAAIGEIVARGSLAVRRSVAESSMQGPRRNAHPLNLAAAYAQFEYGEPIPRHPHFIEIMIQIVQPEVDRMLLGQLTPEEAGARAAAAVNAFLDTFDL
ncbi:MAG: N-Acetyl-D-glucosamine transport system, sugar-binding protein, partial [Verrucomicrobia bacterium]|nr:N-Acetyl-D-glucosamine transport system, sugar-binding protein [Verrucomicrobiota bacterium]